MSKKVAALVPLVVLLAACSNPKSAVIPQDMKQWGDDFKAAVNKLSPSDKSVLEKYLLRTKMGAALGGSDIPKGETIGKAIEDEKAFDAQQAKAEERAAALKLEMEKKREALTQQVNSLLTVSVLKVGLVPADQYNIGQNIEVVVALKNLSNERIDGVEGALQFYDMFGNKVAELRIKDEDGVDPGKVAEWDGSKRYNEFLDNDKALANLVPGKYKAVFSPIAVVVETGPNSKPKVLRLPEPDDSRS
jgi:hypothetical protein